MEPGLPLAATQEARCYRTPLIVGATIGPGGAAGFASALFAAFRGSPRRTGSAAVAANSGTRTGQAFASLAVTAETQGRFNALHEQLGNVGSDALVNLALDALMEHYDVETGE